MALRKSNEFLSIPNSFVIDAPEPANISYFWNFGSLLGTCLVIQLATGIFLAMHYSSNLDLAFLSVQHIMIDVHYGWLIRYAHSNGAGFFFIFVYLHMARGIYYGSYRKPRVALWTIGVVIFLLMIITAFMGKQNNSPKSNYKYNKLNNKFLNKRLFSSSSFLLKNNNKPQDLTDSQQIINEILGKVNIENWWDNVDKEPVRIEIREKLRNKSGIYIIINKITKNYYIGSAIYNRLYTRFSNHLYHLNGNKLVARSIKKYGLNNFIFGVLEYINNHEYNDKYDKKINQELLNLETSYISLLTPKYNIVPEAGNTLGYKHNEESLNKMKIAFTDERRELLRQLQINRKGKWSEESKQRLREVALNRSEDYISREGRIKIAKLFGKPIYLFDENNKYICEFYSISKTANYLCCSTKTIKRSINKGYIYIPKIFIDYLNNNNILEYNSVKDISNIKIKMVKPLKSGLLLTKDKTKFIISYNK